MLKNLMTGNGEQIKNNLSLLEMLHQISEQVSEEDYKFVFPQQLNKNSNEWDSQPLIPQVEQLKELTHTPHMIQPTQYENKMLEIQKLDPPVQIEEEYRNSILNDQKILRELQLSDDCIYDQDGMDFSDENEQPDLEMEEQLGISQALKRDNPARFLRKKKEVNYLYQSKMFQPHSYVKYRYLKKQPFVFSIDMENSAFLILTLHSHLSKHEIIGLIGGSYCKQKREIRIRRIIPCKNIPTKDDYHNVEMDPLSNLQAQHELDSQGLINMGWYHSHPIFKTTPSFIDQRSHEILSKQYDDQIYFGLIISPFKVANKDSICDTFLFFCINKEVCKIEYQLQPVTSIKANYVDHLVDIYKTHLSIHNSLSINSRWKGKCSFLEKMTCSLNAIVAKNNELLAQSSPITNESTEQIPLTILGVQTIIKKFQFNE